MFSSESLWIGDNLVELARQTPGFTLLNVGSSTGHFRKVEQAHIDKNIFQRLQGIATVDHLDLKKADGVDIVGDLTDKSFLQSLKARKYDGVLCSNLLEHVVNPGEICACMEDCVESGAFSIITVPHRYPYHNDPIDTMFRPDVAGIVAMFPRSSLVKGEILDIDQSHFSHMMGNKKQLFTALVRWVTPFYKFSAWKKLVSYIPQTFKKYQVTCVVLRKN